MKKFFYFLLLIFLNNSLAAQIERNLQVIDSIKENVLTIKNIDSVDFANAHYNIGLLYRFIQMGDSSYYHYKFAEKIYRARGATFNLAETIYGYAVLQKNEKDLTGSELASVEVLKLCDQLRQTDQVIQLKSNTYNNLGDTFRLLGQYDEAVQYFEKSIELERSIEGYNPKSVAVTQNNLAITHQYAGNYEEALGILKELLDSNIFTSKDVFYTTVLDNYAYTKFLAKDTTGLPGLFFKALAVGDSLNPTGGYQTIIVNQHLAELYQNRGNKDSALYYGLKAKNIAEKFHQDEVSTSLRLLSKIEEGDKALEYLKEYVRLNDSIQKKERAIRNKSARIRYETQKKEQQIKEITKERMWLLIISIIAIITAILIYVVITQRNKNKELKFIQEQQEANEEIYNLMLSQNDNIEEARSNEKKRISEELHDGVLGRLFGTRLSLDSLNFTNTPEAVKTRSQYINELKTIEEDIRKVSHELNTDFVSGGGFKDIIKNLIETQTLAYNLTYKFNHDDDINWDIVSNKTKIHFYRIIQETLHNIYKHAKAKEVKISFQLNNTKILVILEDDGVGFDVTKAKSGIGLKNMNSRINDIGGTINITSHEGEGTLVKIEAPKN